MANKQRKKTKKKPTPSSRTYPQLHPAVQLAISDSVPNLTYHSSSSSTSSTSPSRSSPTHTYSTNIMGTFRCYNGACATHGWGSKVVCIVIRGYGHEPREFGGEYDAEVFSQRCRGCGRLGKLTVDEESYVERVGYRLRKWAGVLEAGEVVDRRRKRGPPHMSELCEGCKRGVCRRE